MSKEKYIIIGGVAGGATTAARIRRINEDVEIVLFEKGDYISYANCGLPYYIGGVISERENLFLQTPESFGLRFNIDVRVHSEVISIDRNNKEVIVRSQSGEEYKEKYDKLLLSPGAAPVRPAFPGIDLDGIFTLRNVNDTDAIKNYMDTHSVKKAVVVGAGFIGLEMAENLQHAGAEVSIIEMLNQVMPPIDYSMASLVHQHLQDKGVNLYLEHAVSAFTKKGNSIEVVFKNGKCIMADLVILSIGVRPETTLAKQAGLKIGERGGIAVNDYLQTSDENIYAVGDAIEYKHPITGKPWLNYLAGPANRQARICADNMLLGNKIKYEGAIGTAIAKVFDLTVASTGMAAKQLKKEEIPYISSVTHSGSHAGYYPNALQMSIKITFSPENGKLFGAQIVGYDGVDKRLDQIALLIKQQGTIYDLIQLEHAYAPPFSSAKDPIAIAGYVAENILLKRMNIITWRQLQQAQDGIILDVRTPDEFSLGAIPGAVNIPIDGIRDHLNEIPQDKNIYIYCAVGLRGYLASRVLMQHGFNNVFNLSGGYKLYQAATTPVVLNDKDMIACSLGLRDSNANKMEIETIKIDACGLQCPGPIMKLKKSIEGINIGERLEVISTDPAFRRDSQAWCNMTGHKMISQSADSGKYISVIEKVEKKKVSNEISEVSVENNNKGKTFIMFSDDLDKALATFVLANGAVATGEKVTIFFTFWGLNAIKRTKKPKVQKDIFGKMFSMMLPSDTMALKLSKMHMMGIGSKMMRFIMKKKGIDSLESLRQQAIDSGVEFIACQMSMDVMGVKEEELLDNVTIGGVATYMERADKSNINLFI
ncbi:NADPH-dependent 2,4-dienoyl-CoA reductase, sulfur reductase [Bacteroides luti]|uniref:NADPH-dependent 2,4-dienoyl-CoA reductase, sulfur reductase n=1 Tax=Bacteroides luti TaxID=1297750 RepID=A0A1M4V8K5_9BACE|nr:FAD-dependent oxidoreductase [Bacteroides luti]SHE65217.1 NADPH-dependent 2,4-dienoyl-CoA reductase, sulfur reductase [Bacteroides luti]